MSRTTSKHVRSGLTVLLFGAVLITLTASQALAQVTVSTASANAIGGNLLSTGTCTATNDGSTAAPGTQTTGGSGIGCTAGGPDSNATATLAASVLVQTANADQDGTSAACAGVSGPGGGAIQVGPAGPCTGITPGTSAGVNVLGSLVTANAIFSVCSATPAGATGSSTLANVNLGGTAGAGGLLTILGGLGSIVGLGAGAGATLTGAGTLPVNPAPNTTITLAIGNLNIATLILNQQTTVNGTLKVTALNLTLLGSFLTALNTNSGLLGGLLGGIGLGGVLAGLGLNVGNLTSGVLADGINVTIGTVTCGPNAVVPATSALPGKALPVAGGILALLGGAAYLGRRRLFGARA